MNTLTGRKVKYVKLHTTLFVPGFGQLDTTLPPLNKACDLHMTYQPEGIFAIVTGQNGKIDLVIPWGTVQGAVLFPEEVKKASVK